ncbi:flagellar biosynthesis anti-sigma factor FlgM [Halobacillus sp. BBL2006]|uniref:flagellar biosynthesis anti-sigma factor FlgM n=1 Tax=Halobacillus sp. BBL2006 TaxID=1543706 RepID=UPI0005429C0E|nr:flagellar biosynthesis anti-sigma factor FlgM [Halobacillus sp. BBL2006]KHE68130.1 flagellar biosynthesis anti-sigma factor FlgM [Halobacillus sp. BBL2006]
MKINRPNHSQLNPYQKQMNKQVEAKNPSKQQDKIEISKQAKQMQNTEKADPAREKLINQIKIDVDTGNYQVDSKATAKKMIDFWSNKG